MTIGATPRAPPAWSCRWQAVASRSWDPADPHESRRRSEADGSGRFGARLWRVSAPTPILVGGSQRSGTHALAALIAAHPDVAAVPRELVFHAAEDGLPGLLAGTRSAAEIVADLRGRWWYRRPPWDRTVTRGLHKSIPRERLDAAADAFIAGVAADPGAAAGRLLRAVADPFATVTGRRAWGSRPSVHARSERRQRASRVSSRAASRPHRPSTGSAARSSSSASSRVHAQPWRRRRPAGRPRQGA